MCYNEIEYHNERPEDDFSKYFADTALVWGVNREELRSMLTLLGITRQSGPQQYFNKQEEFFKVLWQAANISVENTL